MLHDFVQLKEGDWVVQNGANSAVRVSGVLCVTANADRASRLGKRSFR